MSLLCVALAATVAAGQRLATPTPAPTASPLEQKYAAMQNETCGKVLPKIPALPSGDVDKFMAAYQVWNGSTDETELIGLANKLLSNKDMQAFLGLPDSFSSGGLDADMVLCSVLFDATPAGLAAFASQGKDQEALVDKLLSDILLMRDMLVAGGAKGGNYGQAMQIWTQISSASRWLSAGASSAGDSPWDDRTQDKTAILRRLALGVATENAVPINHRWNINNNTYVDPVARYRAYESAYLAGDLDPAFEVLTSFEMRLATDADATDDDLVWMRTTMANFRPDNIARDYTWRYAEAVHTDVAYGHPACDTMPGICTGRYAQIPAAGGECGPRAFFGRVTRKAFGLPTWGVTQPGHAAMSAWDPDKGWGVLLGAAWQYSWWKDRSGPDFVLEASAREMRPAFQQVLRGGWAANARGEDPVGQNWTPRSNSGYGEGGVWNALMLYLKKITVNKATNATGTVPARPIGPSVVPTKVDALIARWPTPSPAPNATTGPDGTITIPAAGFAFKNRSASVSVMKSFDQGVQLLSGKGSLLDPASTSYGYEVTVDEDATYYLTANVSTWHMNQDLMVSTNTTSAPLEIPFFYTLGYWNETQPIEVKLLKGVNTLTFTRSSDRDISIKEFFLFKKEPYVPPPPGNYTPAPTPSPARYIELPASTTCVKQGVDPTPEDECGRACAILGFKFTGSKARMNSTGCFVLTSGQYAGNCNYNTNTSATCADPPCTVYGCTVQPICIRK